jgi:ribosomal-protein-alanine N-acetyltransferase
VPARGLYEKLGFRQIGRRKGYYRETGEDAIVMELVLNDAT